MTATVDDRTASEEETSALSGAAAAERRGRMWLLWSVIVCPCHLPLTMGLLGAVLGGTTFGALVARNALGVGLVFGTLYIIGLVIGFRHLREAAKGKNCSDGVCEIA